MVKEIDFDLEFDNKMVSSLSERGSKFLLDNPCVTMKDTYHKAVELGLHVRFITADVRDNLI